MPKVRMAIQVTPDRKAVAIEVATAGQAPQQLVLGLEELDQVIGELGNARSQMAAGRPLPDFESEGVKVSMAANTNWFIRASPPNEALFGFHHPKFGPVGLTLRGEQIASIVRFLTARFILHPTKSAEKH
jgi:hypothetical protein